MRGGIAGNGPDARFRGPVCMAPANPAVGPGAAYGTSVMRRAGGWIAPPEPSLPFRRARCRGWRRARWPTGCIRASAEGLTHLRKWPRGSLLRRDPGSVPC